MKEKAVEIYHRVPKTHNCAQSVAEAAGHAELYTVFAPCGGGRAEEGMCGALYAAVRLVPAEQRDAIIREFAAKHGATTCKELKMVKHVPCDECLRTAAELLERFGNFGN